MELSEKLISMVSENKRERIKKLRFPVDQMLAAYSELLVRFIACSQFEIQNSEISFLKNEYGKPYLYGYPDFHFNISHTHNAFVVAVSDSEVGVDIERIHAADIKISDRFFAPAERKFISQAFDKDTAFYQ
ncbi:MAG: phosphopantetheine-protein transferase, partial [Clostridiales bacterium]|nr:phosphopantetheine-protein transferase [Clostridiales bacterium]